MSLVPYFAYGTTQQGFVHHAQIVDLLREPVARVQTVLVHAVVVPRRAACSNPGCRYVHRMAALVPGVEGVRVEGDLFLIGAEAVAALDRLELSGPYVRDHVAVTDGTSTWDALAYPVGEPARWRALVEAGEAEALATYPPDLASAERLKDCCARDPAHAGPHDVIDPLVPPA